MEPKRLSGPVRARFAVVVWICCLSPALGVSGCGRRRDEPPYTPGLGEIMTLTQMRHVKLWFAGQAGNWDLVDYELDELNEGLEDAAKFHPTHKDVELPIPELITKIMGTPIKHLQEAAKAKSQDQFVTAYDELTGACNQCHQATRFGFNVVTRPATNPYPNQDFQPAH